jgi:hypothetical protein
LGGAAGSERGPLDEARLRGLEAAGHSSAPLSAGRLHYELSGPAGGHLVVLIHGVSGPMAVERPDVVTPARIEFLSRGR